MPETQPKQVADPGAGRALRPPGAALALAWLAGYAVFRLVAGLAQLPADAPAPAVAAATALVAVLSLGLPIAALAALARAGVRPAALLGLGLAGGIAWLALAPWPGLAAAVVRDAGKVTAAGCAGLALAAAIREPNILFPASLFAAVADVVVVTVGTVRETLSTEQGQAVLRAVSAEVPSVQAGLPPLTIGPADFLFLGVFLAAAARFGMDVRRTAWGLTLILAAALLLVPFVHAVPALAPMALGFLAVNCRSLRLTRQEFWGSVIVVALAGALFLGYFLLPGRGG